MNYFIHPTSIIDKNVKIGKNTNIWHWCHLSKDVVIGKNCNLGQNIYVGEGVKIEENVKIQNNVSIFKGVTLKKNVFCGPSVVFTNVKFPRSEFKTRKYIKTLIQEGVSIGANSTIICGTKIGKYALIGAGSVITKNIKNNLIVAGNPFKILGKICNCGKTIIRVNENKIKICKFCNYKLINKI